jgi:NADH-quinone oxidoreductase subunit L
VNRYLDLANHPGRVYALAALLPLLPVVLLAIAAMVRNLSRAHRHSDSSANRIYWLLGGDQPMKVGGYLAITAMLGSVALSTWGLTQLLKESPENLASERWAERTDWIRIGSTKAESPAATLQLGYRIDQLTGLMFSMVSVVGTLIFVFAMGYMNAEAKEHVEVSLPSPGAAHHPLPNEEWESRRGRFGRFYLYLSLFAFSMLNLLIADNLFQVFIFWELVGVCSFFLIGFYYERRSASTAANKAFIMNRIGDAGLLIAIGIAFTHFGTLNIQELIAAFSGGRPAGISQEMWIAMGLGLFLGCAGKSAQIPLQTWLPDAMEGPTPVSALIHAATMVAAGVYLVGRCYPLFAPEVLLVIAYVGMLTAFVSATIALVMTDIKRVLAYSTCSQLGFMMLALGVGGWVAGLLHLLTHAFFKALLFLCAGSVIHGCHHEQDLRKMGGLRKTMPITAFTMLVGVLAIAGTPFFSGWYSKDRILADALTFSMDHQVHAALFFVPLLTAGMTAFYMFRLWFLAFAGAPRDPHLHPHESPLVMTIPLIVLALFSIGVAWGWPVWDSDASALGHILEKAGPMAHRFPMELEHWFAEGSAFAVALAGAVLAWMKYGKRAPTPEQLAEPRGLLAEKWHFDTLYDATFRRGTVKAAYAAANFDKANDGTKNRTLDGTLNALITSAAWVGSRVRTVQTGRIRQYVFALALTVLGLLGMLTWLTK